MRLLIGLVASFLIVAGVLWLMWRLPRRDGAMFGVAPWLSWGSVWLGLGAMVGSMMLWWVAFPDLVLAVVLLVLDPGSIAAGLAVFWIYRGDQAADQPTVGQQKRQAGVGIVMGLSAVVMGYLYVMTHKRLFTPVGL